MSNARLFLLLLIALGFALPVPAGARQSPEYAIVVNSPPQRVGDEYQVSFNVRNTGGAAFSESTAFLSEASSGEQLDIQPIQPLNTGEIATITFSFPANALPPGTYSLRATLDAAFTGASSTASVAQTTLAITSQTGSSTTSGSSGTIVTPAQGQTSEPLASPTPVSTPDAEAAATTDTDVEAERFPIFTIPVIHFEFNPNNILHLAGGFLILGILLIALWIFLTVLRLIFTAPPQPFNMWQPPYASMPMLDPNSDAGRRQLWQPHAQNDSVPNPCMDGTYHIRKLFLGTDGDTLSGWRVTAIRISQYDMYGRVARSQIVAPNGLSKRLDRVVRRAGKLDEQRAFRQVKPIARSISNNFMRKVSKNSARLPIALDIRWRGRHGDVRILFELYGCGGGMYQMVDQWEPEMTVRGGMINENFTYTLFGQRPDENMRAFRKRFPEDLTRILADMVLHTFKPLPTPTATHTPHVPPQTQQMQQAPHDTLPNQIPPIEME